MGRIPVIIILLGLVLASDLSHADPDDSYFESDQFQNLDEPPPPPAAKEKPETTPVRVEPSRLPPFGRDGYRTRRLMGRARAKRLATTTYWRRLLHYRKTWRGGYESDADGKTFFLAPDGRTNPAAELSANLRGFLRPRLENGADLRCIFPLRYRWLRGELGNPPELPAADCPALKKYLKSIKADSVSLVFASYYLNSPASMFGHTLIKLNSKGRGGTDLLDWVINFSARVGRTDSLTYVWKGLTGGYPGHYSTLPYHVKLREYNDLQSRDIYEYRLNLTPKEIENLLLHTVELEQTHFDYYYLDENCSYYLLSLLEVVRPKARLTEKYGAWVIPGETLRTTIEQQGLVSAIHYRPSLQSEIRGRLHAMSAEERAVFSRLLSGELSPGDAAFARRPVQTRVKLIDLALKALRFRKSTGDEDPERDKLLDAMLVERAKLPAGPVFAGGEATTAIPLTVGSTSGGTAGPDRQPAGGIAGLPRFSDPPHVGHLPLRFNLGGGASSFGTYGEVAIRPGLHDLLNDDTGYAPHSELEIANLRLRNYQETGRVELEQLTVFKVISLPRFASLSPSVSYIIDSGIRADVLERPGLDPLLEFAGVQSLLRGGLNFQDYYIYQNYIDDSARPAAERFDRVFPGYVDLQTGFTFAREYEPTYAGARLSLLGGVRGEYAPGDPHLSRIGPALSLLSTFEAGAFKFLLKASGYGYSVNGQEDAFEVEAGLRYSLARDLELRLKAGARPDWQHAGLEFAYFF